MVEQGCRLEFGEGTLEVNTGSPDQAGWGRCSQSRKPAWPGGVRKGALQGVGPGPWWEHCHQCCHCSESHLEARHGAG